MAYHHISIAIKYLLIFKDRASCTGKIKFEFIMYPLFISTTKRQGPMAQPIVSVRACARARACVCVCVCVCPRCNRSQLRSA